jgi:hypothetical protein
MTLRRPLLITLGLLALSASIAIGVFVYTFDLNRYRGEIAHNLATALDRPVLLGEARLSLRPGLALSFADLRVGSIDSGTDELSADHMALLIDPWPLLKGELIFREVALDAPRLTLTLGLPKADGPPGPSGREHGLLKTTLIHTLKIENGGLLLQDRRNPDRPVVYEMQDIRGQLTDLSLERPWRMDLFAALVQGEKPAALTLAGEVTPPEDLARWSEARLDVQLGAQGLDPMSLLPRHAASDTFKTEGSLSLQIDLTGAPASGLRIEGALKSPDFSLHLPRLYRSPLPLHQASIKSTWTAAADTHEFTDLTFTADEIALAGNLLLRRQEEKFCLEW